MRLIGTLGHENEASRFVNYLTSVGIGSKCEVAYDAAPHHISYQIWIHDEDKIPAAAADFEEFQRHPANPKFDAPIPEPEPEEFTEERELPEEPEPYRYKNHLTSFILFLCALLYFLNSLEQIPLRKEGLSEQTFLLTPLQAELMYDLPPVFEEFQKIVEKYELTDEKITQIPPEVTAELEAVNQTPYWRGIYDWVVHKLKGEDPSKGEGPLFFRIRQGEVWRLISPVVMHSDLLHILFNMLWLWYLGRPVEQRIGPMRTLLLSVIAGVGSNTLQYLMTGPFFIGYSGIITALAGFIWMREKKAPWEGYPLNRSTILFLLFFIGSIFVIQLVSFFIQIFTTYQFAPNIANTAHIGGALIGAYLGQFSFFAQRIKK